MAKLKIVKQKVLPSGLYYGRIKKYFLPRGKNYIIIYVDLKLDDGSTQEQPIFVNNGWLDSCKFVRYANSINLVLDEYGEIELEEFIGKKVQLLLEEVIDDDGNIKNEVIEILEHIEIE